MTCPPYSCSCAEQKNSLLIDIALVQTGIVSLHVIRNQKRS